METRGHAAIADAFGQEGEGQEDSVRQGQSSSSRQSVLAVARVGALQKICHILQKNKTTLCKAEVPDPGLVIFQLFVIYRIKINDI